MARIALISAVVLAILAAAGVGTLAWADSSAAEKLPPGARVAGVDVGGLTREQALERASLRVGTHVARPAHLQLDDRRFTLTAAQAGVRVDLNSAIERVHAAGRDGSFVSRGWRRLTGEKIDYDTPVPVTVDPAAIRSFVERIAREQERKPVNAALEMTLTSVRVTPARSGRRLAARDALVARLTRLLTSRAHNRLIPARTIAVEPTITEDKVFDSQPVAVAVSRTQRQARVFLRGTLVKTYTVAVGSEKYPTPTGSFVVQTMQKNPSWNVPQSEWAGELAGDTIPGGDPRNPLVARWVGFNGSVGFHGTKSAGSLGTAASHGCIRMSPADVIDLFERLSTGAPVLVA